MSSRVLALKYRPQGFSEVIGQETTVRILENALRTGRLHHAYLFSGPRGVGKTTMARIFAKALNCEKGTTPDPCQACVSCREIMEGRSLSVMEIDGASNTSVEDVRDLRERIRYLPPGGRYKIYIIDEVHMLSTAAFNALLKTLEEPPSHALFLFATTEPHKIPPTVLSRVIRFDLNSLPSRVIVERLLEICKRESFEAEETALFAVARKSEGSLRDALSLLDQVVSFSGPKITVQTVEGVIGVSGRQFVLKIAEALLNRNAGEALKLAQAATAAGVETKRLALELLEGFRHLLVSRLCQDPALFDLPREDVEALHSLSQKASSEDLDRLFQILQKGIADLLRSPLPKVLLDVLLVRLSSYESLRPLDEILKILIGSSLPLKGTSLTLFNQAQRAVEGEAPTASPVEGATRAPTKTKTWVEFLSTLRSKKPQVYSIVEQGHLIRLTENEAVLGFSPGSIHASLLQDEERLALLSSLAKEFFGRPLTIRLETKPAAAGIVDEAVAIFGAKVERGSP